MSIAGKERRLTGIADVVQHVLSAESVDVHLAGRASLSARSSLRFIADHATNGNRLGFAVDGQPEKYQIRGGLAGDELDDLFRAAGGDRVERDIKVTAADWLAGATVPAPRGVPNAVANLLAGPASADRAVKLAELLTSGQVRKFAESQVVRPEPQSSATRQHGDRSTRR